MQLLIFCFLLSILVVGCTEGDSVVKNSEEDIQAYVQTHNKYIAKLLGYEAPNRWEQLVIAMKPPSHVADNKRKAEIVELLDDNKSNAEIVELQRNKLSTNLDKVQNILTLMYQEKMTEFAVLEGYSIFCDQVELPASGEQALQELQAEYYGKLRPGKLAQIESHYRKMLGNVISDIEVGRFKPNCDLMSSLLNEFNINIEFGG